jgi:hypothetical protein
MAYLFMSKISPVVSGPVASVPLAAQVPDLLALILFVFPDMNLHDLPEY